MFARYDEKPMVLSRRGASPSPLLLTTLLLSLWCVLFLGAGCGPDGPGGTDPPTPVVKDMGVDMPEPEEDMGPPRQDIARIEVEPEEATLERGDKLQLVASLFDDEDQPISGSRILSWTTSDPTVAKVDTRGEVEAVGYGVSTISIKGGMAEATVAITVPRPPITRITLEPEEVSVQVRSTVQLRATAYDGAGDEVPGAEISWTTEDEDVATVTSSGLVTGQSVGSTSIVATHEELSVSSAVTVDFRPVDRVEILTKNITLRVNEVVQMQGVARDDQGFILENRMLMWSAMDEGLLEVDAITGEIKGLAAGMTVVTLSAEGETTTTEVRILDQPIDSIELVPTSYTLSAGLTLQMTATPKDALGNPLEGRTLTWTATNPSVATVDSDGLVTGQGAGLGRIQVEAEGKIAEAAITVQNPVTTVEVTPTMPSIQEGEQLQFMAKTLSSTGSDLFRNVVWSTSDTNIATIDSAGLLTSNRPGQIKVRATSEMIVGEVDLTVTPKPVDSVTVAPEVVVMFVNDAVQLVASTFAADGSPLIGRAVSWSSDKPLVASVDATTGQVTAFGTGKANITATSEGVTGSAVVVVPVTFKTIAAGVFHSCGVDVQDKLYCWGRNYDNALGSLGGNAFYPREINITSTFTHITVLSSHTCALDAQNKAFCWGSNYAGQCGTGASSGTTASPTQVQGNLSFTQLSAGGSHTCGLIADGTAYCWGDNDYGQLGNNTQTDSSTPSQVFGSVKFSHIDAGGNHTCAVGLADAKLYCWGRNNYGQISDANLSLNAVVPTDVSATNVTYTRVSAGASHTCMIATTGETYCVGRNFDGQLGQNTGGADSTSQLPVGGGSTFQEIFAGADHTCAMTSAGALYCWGANDVGQLGDGTTSPSTTPVAVDGGQLFQSFDVGGRHNCGVTTNGVAYCWGSNSEGRLGNGTNAPSYTPYPVVIN